MTDERQQKIVSVLNKRQYDLGIVLENVEDPHNIAAILRTCDAAGIQDIYVIGTRSDEKQKLGWKSSRSATKWMTVHHFNHIKDCMLVVKQRFNKILTTHLSSDAVSLYKTDLTESVALVLGNEKKGLSDEILKYSDGNIVIPQLGMLQSLNISVACAVISFEAMRQRELAGKLDQVSLPSEMYNDLLNKWTYKRKSSK